MTFTVAILGRPNVGKSTLFNRLVGKRLALVDDRPGVTRDRREAKARLGGMDFTLVDTAGLEEADEESLAGRMSRSSEQAAAEADLVLLLIDARAGVTPTDKHFAKRLRRLGKPTVLVANKCENAQAAAPALAEAWGLGLGEAVAVSAEHGEGMDALKDAIAAHLPPGEAQESSVDEEQGDKPRPLLLAVVGRPNVGKSTLVNALIGRERMLTGPEAGITRDAIAVDWAHKGRPVRLVDTAGLRKRAKVEAKLERLSVADTLRTVRFAEVVILVIDAVEMLERQDLQIARLAIEEGRGLVLAVNKWDAVENRAETLKILDRRIELSLPQVKGLPVITISARNRQRLDALIDAAFSVHAAWNKRVVTPALNRWLKAMIESHSPPLVQGRRLKPRYIAQTGIRPPSFTLFLNKAASLPDDYQRYLVNEIRRRFDLPGTPIRLTPRQGDNPFAGKKRK
jgi:GTP-binding protein